MTVAPVNEEPPEQESVGESTSSRLRALLARPIPPEELDENTRFVAAPARRGERSARAVLVARLGGEWLGFDVRVARRVVRVAAVHRVPHRTHDAFAGIANIAGELALVAKLDRILGVEHRGDAQSQRMIVLGDEGRSWVVLVDGVEGVMRLDAASFRAPPATVDRAIDGMTEALAERSDGKFVAVLESDRLLRALARCIA
ncbi:MAG: chemotaxis protein CheW [Phycisphaerales bacterium]